VAAVDQRWVPDQAGGAGRPQRGQGGLAGRDLRRAVQDDPGAFLTEQWLPTARAAVRPTTWTTYRIYAEAHVVPALGRIPLQALTAAHLNRLYAHLAEHGRRDGRGGLNPKSVRHVHVLLHKALSSMTRRREVTRDTAAQLGCRRAH
jgi:hypothetical protein